MQWNRVGDWLRERAGSPELKELIAERLLALGAIDTAALALLLLMNGAGD